VSFWLIAALAALATFAASTLLGSVVACVAVPSVVRVVDAASRARWLVALRALPTAAGVALAVWVVIPAFVLFEPRGGEETPGAVLLVLALFGALWVAAAVRRAAVDLAATRRLGQLWATEGRAISLPGWAGPAHLIRHPFPLVSVVGVVRPRLFVAEQVVEALSESELRAVLAHETGHIASGDNLKRLILRLLPALPWPGASSRLDEEWDEAAEEAADTHAPNALELAAALVKTARLAPAGARLDLPVAAFHRGDSVARRVRLLTEASEWSPPEPPRRAWAYGLALAAALAGAWSAPVLVAVHAVLEHFVHLL
jgi:Zn-dependent protease with chaperone function